MKNFRTRSKRPRTWENFRQWGNVHFGFVSLQMVVRTSSAIAGSTSSNRCHVRVWSFLKSVEDFACKPQDTSDRDSAQFKALASVQRIISEALHSLAPAALRSFAHHWVWKNSAAQTDRTAVVSGCYYRVAILAMAPRQICG